MSQRPTRTPPAAAGPAEPGVDAPAEVVVLNTRPREQAAELSALLRQAGFRPAELPAIEIVPAWRPAERARVAARLRAGDYAWVVLGSRNAGRYLREAVGADALDGARVLCGQATAAALGLSTALSVDRFSAQAALEVLRPLLGISSPIARPAPTHASEPAPTEPVADPVSTDAARTPPRVLVPRAAEGREELVDGLQALGVEVDAPVCYRTAPVPAERLRAAGTFQADVITLCSPSAVQALLAAWPLPRLQRLPLVCLGETTAQAARAAGLRVDAVAARTSMPDLVAAVRSLLDQPASPAAAAARSVVAHAPAAEAPVVRA